MGMDINLQPEHPPEKVYLVTYYHQKFKFGHIYLFWLS
jgi:hypothetical protein